MWVGSTLSQTQEGNSKKASEGVPPAIELTLDAVHDLVQSGSPVEVKVTVTNISGRVFLCKRQAVTDRGGFDYKFDIRDEKGSVPSDTKFHHTLNMRGPLMFAPPQHR